MLEIGQFVEIRPQGRKARPQVGVIIGLSFDKSGVCRMVKVYVRTHHLVVGTPTTAVKPVACPPARREGDTLITGKGLKISLKTGYPL